MYYTVDMLSADILFIRIVSLDIGTKDNYDSYQPGRYIACTYDNEWLIRNIVERSDSNNDLVIIFMQRKKKTRLLWPRNTDRCWVPFPHILCTVDVPLVEGTSARDNKLSQQDYNRVVMQYDHCK